MAKGRSARGEIVDFDLLKIKEQIAAAPKTTNVRAREDFIDQKFKRRIRKTPEEVAAVAPTAPVEDVVENVVVVEEALTEKPKKVRIAPAKK